MAKNKNSARRKQQKAKNYKSTYQRGKKHVWDQLNHLQHYEGLPTEYYTESDLGPPILEKPSLAHLDLDDTDLQTPTTNRSSVFDHKQLDPATSLTSTVTTIDPSIHHLPCQDDPEDNFCINDTSADTNNTTIMDTHPDDCFFFDETPADVNFSHPTIFIDGNTSNTKEPVRAVTPTPDIQTISLESKRTKKKRKQHRNKVKTAKKIIPGDDIYIDISSGEDDDGDDDPLMPATFYTTNSDTFQVGFNDDDDDDDDGCDDDRDEEDITYTFHQEAALDQDFIENTDPETWQLLQQWATQRSVDDQSYEGFDDSDESMDINNNSDDLWDEDGGRDPIADFGLDDSEDDEFIQQYIAHQQHQQQLAQDLQSKIRNTLPTVPPSLHKGMYGFLQHNRQYTSKNITTILGNHTNKDIDTYSGQLRRLDRRIQLFLNDGSRQMYQLPEMTLYCRQLVEGLVKFYHIKISSDDMNEQKLGVLLKKCPKTQSPKNRQSIERYIDKAQVLTRRKRRGKLGSSKILPGKSSSSSRTSQGRDRHRRSGGSVGRGSGGGGGSGGFRSGKAVTTTPHAEHGTVVGLAAAPLASDNVGHKLLAKMGWKEGEALGTNKDGIADPIQAVIRARNRGLGA